MKLKDLKVGDMIEFKSPTRHHRDKAKRKITGITDVNCTVTKFHDQRNFIVFEREIIKKID